MNTIRHLWESLLHRAKPATSRDGLDYQSVLLPPGPLWSRLFLWILGSASISLVLWSVLTRVEEVVLLSGSLRPVHKVARVLAPTNGLLTTVNISPFQKVSKGQVLFEMDRLDVEAQLKSLRSRLSELERSQNSLLSFHQTSHQSLVSELAHHRDLLSRYQKLGETGTISAVQVLSQKNYVTQSEARVAQSLHELADKTSAFRSQRSSLLTEISVLSHSLNDLTIVSPLSGVVHSLDVQVGGVRVSGGSLLAEIVPSRLLSAEVNVPSAHRDSIRLGTPAMVDVDAFPAREFGLIKSEIISISPTTFDSSGPTVPNAYVAKLKLLAPERHELLDISKLLPGMNITARVSTRTKPVIATVFEFFSNFYSPMVEEK